MTNFYQKYKKLYWLMGLSLLIIGGFFAVQKKPKILDGSRIKIIDNIEKNYLLRGSNPFVNEGGKRVFSYQVLKKYINQSLQASGEEPIDDFYLITVNLLNFDGYFQIKEEKDFFKKNPSLGRVESYSEISPELLFTPLDNNLDNQIIAKITSFYHEDLTKNLANIYKILNEKQKKPIVIYMHCNAGRDRTGLMAGVYRLNYKKMNLQQVIDANIEDVGRSSESLLESALFSYCNYFKREKNKENNFCLVK